MAGWYDHRGELSQRLGLPGISHLPEYRAWVDMRRRCTLPHRKEYANYGARGIKVCHRWMHSFEAFLEDMGMRPGAGYSIDRIDNDGNYEPSNCRWATTGQQANNKRQCRFVQYRGRSLSLREAVRLAGDVIEKSAARRRLELGWSIERAVETPPDPSFQRNRRRANA